METWYDILGVSRDATPDEIRAAYRRLAKQYHPDINQDPGANERFTAIQQAYETLIDPESRARHDLTLRGDAGPASHDLFRYRPAGGEEFTWRWQMSGPGTSRTGFRILQFTCAVLILIMLALSLLFRALVGKLRQ